MKSSFVILRLRFAARRMTTILKGRYEEFSKAF